MIRLPFFPGGFKPVYVLEKIRTYLCTHRVENKINSLPAGQFCGRNEIAVARNQDNLVNLLLVSKRSNVDAYTHIDTLLRGVKQKVILGDFVKATLAQEQLFCSFWL